MAWRLRRHRRARRRDCGRRRSSPRHAVAAVALGQRKGDRAVAHAALLAVAGSAVMSNLFAPAFDSNSSSWQLLQSSHSVCARCGKRTVGMRAVEIEHDVVVAQAHLRARAWMLVRGLICPRSSASHPAHLVAGGVGAATRQRLAAAPAAGRCRGLAGRGGRPSRAGSTRPRVGLRPAASGGRERDREDEEGSRGARRCLTRECRCPPPRIARTSSRVESSRSPDGLPRVAPAAAGASASPRSCAGLARKACTRAALRRDRVDQRP